MKVLTKRDVQPLSLTKHPYDGQRGKSIDYKRKQAASDSINNVSKQFGFLFGLGMFCCCCCCCCCCFVVFVLFVSVWLFGFCLFLWCVCLFFVFLLFFLSLRASLVIYITAKCTKISTKFTFPTCFCFVLHLKE